MARWQIPEVTVRVAWVPDFITMQRVTMDAEGNITSIEYRTADEIERLLPLAKTADERLRALMMTEAK